MNSDFVNCPMLNHTYLLISYISAIHCQFIYGRCHTFVPGRHLLFSDEKTLLRQAYVYYHIFARVTNKQSLSHLSDLTNFGSDWSKNKLMVSCS